jgi:hypothetical protein
LNYLTLTRKIQREWTLDYYNLPERDEFVTIAIRVMIKFNKGVVVRPNTFVTHRKLSIALKDALDEERKKQQSRTLKAEMR